MIAVDWSHNKGLTVYDGKKLSVVDRKALARVDEESKGSIKSNSQLNSSTLVALNRTATFLAKEFYKNLCKE